MVKFKQLNWCEQDDPNGYYAAPYGLSCRYSIIHVNHHIEFAVLNQFSYEYEHNYPEICGSIAEAKEKAAIHYSNLLKQVIEP